MTDRKPNTQTVKLSFFFPIEAYFQLEEEANARGTSAPRLATKLLEIICKEGLFRAVDDGVDAVPKKKRPPKGVNGGGRQRLFVSSI
jgi:hypothetical protein